MGYFLRCGIAGLLAGLAAGRLAGFAAGFVFVAAGRLAVRFAPRSRAAAERFRSALSTR